MRYGLLFLVAWLGYGPWAQARDLYVDNVAGNNYYGGDAPVPGPGGSGPLRSIGEALRRAHKHDRIVLAKNDEPYRESLSLSSGRHSGDVLQPFVIAGNGATLDGSVPAPEADWQVVPNTNGLFRCRPPRLAYQQLFLNDRPAQRVPIASDAPRLVKLDPLQWCYDRGDIYFRPEPEQWINSYKLTLAELPVGITLYKVRNVIITDLVVQGYQLDGINAHDTQDCQLLGVTCRGNGRSGVASVGATRLTLDRCLLGDNGSAQLLSEGYAITRVLDSQLIGNTAPEIVRHGGQVLVQESPPEEPAIPQ